MKTLSFNQLVQETGLSPHDVRYRLSKLKPKTKYVHRRCFLYPESAVEAVKNYGHEKETNKDGEPPDRPHKNPAE